jgi:hypothetical protein
MSGSVLDFAFDFRLRLTYLLRSAPTAPSRKYEQNLRQNFFCAIPVTSEKSVCII